MEEEEPASAAGNVTEEETEETEESEISELQRARERSGHLDQEILALSSRIRSFDLSLLPIYQDQTSLGLSPVQQTLLDASEEAGSTFTSDGDEDDDFSDPKTEDLDMELELELLRRPQEERDHLKGTAFTPEEAQQEIAELQLKLKESQQQIQLYEAQALGRKRLEEEVEDLREKEAEARHQMQEEQQKRKALDHQMEELQQEMTLQKEKEAHLEGKCAEFQIRAQQQESRIRVLEEEKKTFSNELLCCQTDRTTLLEQIVVLQREKEGLLKQMLRLQKRMDASARKRQERRERRKAKLRRVKEVILLELKRRESCIQSLENKLHLARGHAEKMSSANGELLQQRKRLLAQLQDCKEEAIEHNHTQQRLCAVQSRVELLGEEHKRQQERSVHLAAQVGDLERALRRISGENLQETQSQILPFSGIRTFRSLAAL